MPNDERGILFLLPNVLFDEDTFLFPEQVGAAVRSLNGLIAEEEKAGRRYLKRFGVAPQLPIRVLNEHTAPAVLDELLLPIEKGERWGVISDAGLPCIADPGSNLVRLARRKGIPIRTFAGPCSLVIALQLSGFSGQHFAFHGYLPREGEVLAQKLLEVEKRCAGETQIWIEAPYRSAKMFAFLLEHLKPTTMLCVAASLMSPVERVDTKCISEWRNIKFLLDKEPVVFLISN